MEFSASPSNTVKQTPIRKLSSSGTLKDLWFISKQGSLAELDSALALLKKHGGNIDARNTFGLTPLHIATWRNHVPIVRRLLAAGSDPDARDGESGWSSLHRALHFGHLAVAGVLLQSGASLTLEDPKGRTPLDLLSGPVSQVVGTTPDSVATEVFSWGSGTNYQLGTGNAHIQKLPCKIDALQGTYIKIIAASKFHSVAVTSNGELYTWGFGRGGRLGHPDFDIHSGQAAVITPRLVTLGLGARQVRVVAAAKHHTVVATEAGEVFTWGSNREGQLGYTSVDTQPTPRRVSSLRAKVIAVAAANKHSAVVADSGEVYTWGCNKEGQLGYGTSNSASNYTPRMVEYLKGKVFRGISAAKYHTIVLGADGEVFTWGHRLVTPRRVIIARCLKKSGNTPLKFHRAERLHVTSVAAGFIHSTALTDDGSLFYWVSSDPDLSCHQLYWMAGRKAVSISAGKYWTAAVTDTGDVYMWDGKKYKDETPSVTRLHGVKRATSICVGETHLIVLSAHYHPVYPPKQQTSQLNPTAEENVELEELDEEILFSDVQTKSSGKGSQNEEKFSKGEVPSLKSLCEKVACEFLVEPRNAVQLLEIADSLEADELRKHCEEIAVRNLDYIFTFAAPAVVGASSEILAKLERLLDSKSSEPWSYRHLPTMTATFPAIINSDGEGDSERGFLRIRDIQEPIDRINGGSSFLEGESTADQAVLKQVRALRKKLQQIEMLEAKQLNGHHLDDQQLAKLGTKDTLESALMELGFPFESELKPALLDVKVNRKAEVSRKQRRKNKQKGAQSDTLSVNSEEKNPIKAFEEVISVKISEEEEVDTSGKSKVIEDISLHAVNAISRSLDNKAPCPTPSKKKNRKGGLSLFLSGALDDTPKQTPTPPPPPTPKSEGPAWGGAKITKGLASLRDIQNEQSKTKEIMTAPKAKDRVEDPIEPTTGGQIRLASFLPAATSSPIAVASVRGGPASDGEKGTPPWSSAGNSPTLSRPSLRDIQMQQEKKHQSLSHSPKITTSGFSIPSHSSTSDVGSSKASNPSRWFKPDTDAPSSIRSIQIEERAMKDLKRFYSSVKLVKP
ncbi:uncharacterized protein LOC109715170 [Ananas comosus]|uniref:Uncharacterized protein LOC109715170 n=1 Tax=Ananas comosus TaxID=4615 RepID=A0A6P5FI85_ANACO|nr:uncharacterized protein LOC109715170 [Ananas comosus]